MTSHPEREADELTELTALREHLLGLVEELFLTPLEILGTAPTATRALREWAAVDSSAWAGQLLGPDAWLARQTATRLTSALRGSDGEFNPPTAWWGTPLGRVVARTLGHPGTEAISYAVAGAMLGVTRQAVHDLVVRGKLERSVDGGVVVASVQARLVSRRSRTATSSPAN